MAQGKGWLRLAGGPYPKGTCSASLHGVGDAGPYGVRCKGGGVRADVGIGPYGCEARGASV